MFGCILETLRIEVRGFEGFCPRGWLVTDDLVMGATEIEKGYAYELFFACFAAFDNGCLLQMEGQGWNRMGPKPGGADREVAHRARDALKDASFVHSNLDNSLTVVFRDTLV